ncbi:MAG TPA: hypothetical protein IAB03_01240 [Candidatus Gallibacteroides avistercoris]|uniref:Uncharacterized protein n=1 Tax=Candidatus Gallibacteroides avistercoris TaxID=2840833 RepID=A0A9D1SCD4_9BACT|nr:hypothetical protein [Candidatus Gallibacteroides avistercoris]
MIAYSADGYKKRTWVLPADCFTSSKVSLYRISHTGREFVGKKSIGNGKITLTLASNEMLLITQE